MEEGKRVEEMNYFELLAWLGIGSSHPGGFPATLQNLEALLIKSDEYVLDAGCGTGLTACYLAKKTNCKIVGIDINPEMIQKARLRAEKEKVSHLVEFKVADVYQLPFPDHHFDLVFAESITVFLDKEKVYQEFYRVLKSEGKVADLEMALLRDLPLNLRKQMEECFGPHTNPVSFQEWVAVLRQAGFQDVEIKNAQPMINNRALIFGELKKDWLLVKELALKVSSQPSLLPRLQKNAGFMMKNMGYYGFGMVYGRKPTPPKLSFKDRIRQILFSKYAGKA